MSEPDEAAVEAVMVSLFGPANWSDRSLRRREIAAVLATPVVADWRRDAERLRNLAARFEGHLNRGLLFTGAEIAAMLRGDS